MNISIIPQKMESGMIVAIQVKTDEKEEVFTIPPAPFETFEAMKAVISKYYETNDIWTIAKQEYELAKQRFDLIDFRHKAALQDFKLLIAPKTEPKATVVQEPKKEPVITKPEITPEQYDRLPSTPLPERGTIVPPGSPAEIAQQASIAMQERAEKAGEELKNATVIIDQPKEVVQEVVQALQQSDSDMVKMFKDHSTILTSEVKDMLPEKAKNVLDNMTKRIETAQAAADMSKPLEQPQKPISIQDWVKIADKTITDRRGGTEFDEETLETELVNCGVPTELVEKVKNQLIKSWEKGGRFEQKEGNSFFLILKSLSEKVGLGKKKKKPD